MSYFDEKKAGKKRILVFPFDIMSHYLRCLELVNKLYDDCEVLFASSESYNHFVEDKGFKTFSVESFETNTVLELAKQFDFSWLNAQDIERVYLSQVEVIQEYEPDMVLGDMAPGLKMAAESVGIPYLTLMNGYMTNQYARVRKLSRSHRAYGPLSPLPVPVVDAITKVAEQATFKQIQKSFNKVRDKYGLRRERNYLTEMEGDINYICDSEDLIPLRKHSAKYINVGPLYYRTEERDNTIHNGLNHEKLTITVCMGSSGDVSGLSFLKSPFFKQFNIIFAGVSEEELKIDHAVYRDFVNLDQVLPLSDIFFCHGGTGTVYHALEHGLFPFCYTSHFEKEWNVQALEAMGKGMSINDLTQHEVITHIGQVLSRYSSSGEFYSATAFSLH